MNSIIPFQTGTLWSQLLGRTERAVCGGALHSIPTRAMRLEDGGVRFLVRVIDNIERKRKAKHEQTRRSEAGTANSNPFLPYDENMFVAHASESHVCLLNKYNVVDHHLLIVTHKFEHQDRLLTTADFAALWRCMVEYPSLGFYNGGVVAGASQPHKHLQLVPLPLADGNPGVPIEAALSDVRLGHQLATSSMLPFAHALVGTDDLTEVTPAEAAPGLRDRYDNLLRAVGLSSDRSVPHPCHGRPYNILLTREWMLLVPRTEEFFQTISINALGFAGSLFVRNEQEMAAVKEKGPMAVLRHVGCRVTSEQGPVQK